MHGLENVKKGRARHRRRPGRILACGFLDEVWMRMRTRRYGERHERHWRGSWSLVQAVQAVRAVQRQQIGGQHV